MSQGLGASALAVSSLVLRTVGTAFYPGRSEALHAAPECSEWSRTALPRGRGMARRPPRHPPGAALLGAAGAPKRRTLLRLSWAPWASTLQAATEQPSRRRWFLVSCTSLQRTEGSQGPVMWRGFLGRGCGCGPPRPTPVPVRVLTRVLAEPAPRGLHTPPGLGRTHQ